MGEFAYSGLAGRTRTELVRVFPTHGGSRELHVYRVVNVAEHPHLREPALRGTLHVLDDGEPVQVPFVYHDPERRHFVLVVPYEARNRELAERSSLLNVLMQEAVAAVPDYVRHFSVVYGAAGLSEYLERRARVDRGEELEAWSNALRREDEVIRDRARELEERALLLEDVRRSLPVGSEELELEVIDLVELDGDREVPITSVVARVRPDETMTAVDVVEDASDGDVADDADLQLVDLAFEIEFAADADVFDLPMVDAADDDDVEEIGFELGPAAASGLFQRVPAMIPPADFWRRADTELAVVVAEEAVWLFVQINGEDPSFAEGSTDLLVQFKAADQVGVVALTLHDEEADELRRTYLDPCEFGDRELLDLLASEFTATVVVYNEARELQRSFRVESPREPNVKLLLERVDRLPMPSEPAWERALECVRTAPPSVRDGNDPFEVRGPAETAEDAWKRLRALEAWSTPERIDEAVLIRSIPRTDVELARRQILLDALHFGIAPLSVLLSEAVRFGLGRDADELVAKLHKNFVSSVGSSSFSGLNGSQITLNWEALSKLGRLYGVELSGDETEPS